VFGLTFDKLLIVAIIAAFLIGPERLPVYAARLGQLTRSLRDFANGAKTRMREEMGPEFDEVDWKKLDPRQYDPRRIIREALLDDQDTAATGIIKPVTESASLQRRRQLQAGALPPFDAEST
jgi:sec-independent protein translocase protein TatB